MDTNADSPIERQRRWLVRRGHELDDAGRLLDWRDNLIVPLGEGRRRELRASGALPAPGPGREDPKPVALHEPHATEALVVNLLAPVLDADRRGDAADALGARPYEHATLGGRLRPLHDGADPVPLAFALRGAAPTFALARFCEPWAAGGPARRLLAAELASEPWRGLWSCRGLAIDLCERPGRLASLDVASLLRAALRLQRDHGPRGFRLLYLWYDHGDASARRQRDAIDRFRVRAGGEIDFVAHRFQDVFAALATRDLLAAAHRTTLADRYFPDDDE